VKVTARDLADFREHLGEHGLSPGTIEVYERDVRIASETGGFLKRLRDEELSPKTRRRILAAARSWATFREDDALAKQMKKLRLPPPRRKSARIPIERVQLFSLLDRLGHVKDITDPMRGVLGMLAARGFRCGDVLRLKRTEIESGLDSGTLVYEAKGRRRLAFTVTKVWRKWIQLIANAPGDWKRVRELISPAADPKTCQTSARKAVQRALIETAVSVQIYGMYPHQLRRTYAVQYLRAMQGDPEAVPKLTAHMQWADMTTALEYVDHDRGAELDKIAERMFEREKDV
jgi:integrase